MGNMRQTVTSFLGKHVCVGKSQKERRSQFNLNRNTTTNFFKISFTSRDDSIDSAKNLLPVVSGRIQSVAESCDLTGVSNMLPGKGTMVAVGVGATAVVAAPVVLTGLGFGAAGVAGGSIAAAIQGPAVASGSWFALCQSAGVLGTALTTKLAIGASATAATKAAISHLPK